MPTDRRNSSRRASARSASTALGCLIWLPLSDAQTVYEADFDTKFPSFGYSYGYSGFGELDFSATDTSSRTPSSYDVDTPPAATATFDSSQWMLPGYETHTYAGWGLGIGFSLPEGMRPTSADLSEYTVSFDAKVTGYDENVAATGLETPITIILQGPNHGAQKSTSKGRSLRSTWRPNVAVVNSMGSPVNKGCWQRPQLG